MFERLWKNLRRSTNADGTHDERRAHTRHEINVETKCESVGEGSMSGQVRVRDISRGGMKFLSSSQLEPGTLIRIALPAPGNSETEVLACVMHCTRQSDGNFAVGCAFSDELGDAELKQFGGRKERSSTSDKRAWMRFAAHGEAEYLVLPPTGLPGKRAEIVNISPTGIGLFVDEKIEPGIILDLLLKTISGEQIFDILACVVYAGPRSEGGWIAGCHFIRELDEADMQKLL